MILKLDNSEINDVMDIWLKTNIETHSFIPIQYWIDNLNIVKEHYLPASTTFVHKESDKINAFISILNNTFIGALFVSRDYQNRGIGKSLINYYKDLSAYLELAVYLDNTQAIRFYKKCGFCIISEQLNHSSGFPEYIMSWSRK